MNPKRLLAWLLTVTLIVSFAPFALGTDNANNQVTVKGQLVYKIKTDGDAWFKTEFKYSNEPLTLHYTSASGTDNSVDLTTDDNGKFSAVVNGPITGAYVYVRAMNDACYIVPNADTDDALSENNTYDFQSAAQQYKKKDKLDLGKISISPAETFHIAHTVKRGYDFWVNAIGDRPTRVPVKWSNTRSVSENTDGPISLNDFDHTFIKLNGGMDEDTDYCDDSVILHEYGHWIMNEYAIAHVRGGSHGVTGSASSTQLTFSEGWATFFGQSVLGHSLYHDSKSGWLDDLDIDIEEVTYLSISSGKLPSWKTISPKGKENENWVAGAMWDVTDKPYASNQPIEEYSENWDKVEAPFNSVANAMVSTVENSPVDHNSTFNIDYMRAEINDLYRQYASNNYNPNTEEMYNFWRIFNENGMQFDKEVPTITLANGNLGNITSPTNVTATVRDNVKVKQVQFIVDGKTKKTVKNPDETVTYTIDPAKFAKGDHSLQIRAYDFAGNFYTESVGSIAGEKNGWFFGLFKSGEQIEANFAPSEEVIDNDPAFTQRLESPASFIGDVIHALASIFDVPRDEYSSQMVYFSIGNDSEVQKFATSSPQYDNMGEIINQMGYGHDVIPDASLNNLESLQQYDAVFLNCNSSADSYAAGTADVLKQYVNDGGVLYASDWAYAYIKNAFPDSITFADNPKYGYSQNGITAHVDDVGLATTLGSSTVQINMDLSKWVVIEGTAPTTTTLVSGTVSTAQGQKTVPLLVSFKYGKGKVFYTSFHNEKQITADVEQVLNYLVLSMDSSSNEDTLSGKFDNDNYGYSGSTFGQLSANSTSPLYNLQCQKGYEYNVMLDKSLGDFSLALQSPAGTVYKSNDELPTNVQNYQEGYILTDVSGDWKYFVESGSDIPDNTTFLVGSGKKPQKPMINEDGILTESGGGELLFESGNIQLSGNALANSAIVVRLVDSGGAEIQTDTVNAANGVFNISLHDIEDGNYYLALRSEADGQSSWDSVYAITVDTSMPEIIVGNDYTNYVFGQSMKLTGSAMNAHSVEISVNGVPVPVVYLNTDGGLAYSADITLTNGNNEVVITATNRFSKQVSKTLSINADTATADAEKSTPVITRISGIDDGKISSDTTVTVEVENGNKDETTLRVVSDNNVVIGDNLTPNDNEFIFTISPSSVGTGEKALTIIARNKWGHMDTRTITVLVSGSTSAIQVHQPGDMSTAINQQVSLRLSNVFTASSELSYDGNFGEITSSGDWIFTPSEEGEYDVILNASSASGENVVALFSVSANAQENTGNYTISFNANGGNVTPLSAVTTNGKLASLPTPTRSSYSFGGWFTDATAGTQVTTSTEFTENATLYAHWTYVGGSIGGGGGGGGSSSSVSYQITLPSNPVGGKITSNHEKAASGVKITLTVTPDTDYELEKLEVTKDDNSTVSLTKKSGNKIQYTFVMPSSKVTVVASFKKSPDNTSGETPSTSEEVPVSTPSTSEEPPTPTPSTAEQKGIFTDISPASKFYPHILWAVDKEITLGNTPTTFNPDGGCTRAQAVTFLWRAAGAPDVSGNSPFIDVNDPNRYFYKPVLWAVQQGITSGVTATTFEPYSTCTRAQIVTFLYRMSKDDNVNDDNPFTDVRASSAFYTAILWAVDKGITNGVTQTTFQPSRTCTRAQIVTFIHRYIGD